MAFIAGQGRVTIAPQQGTPALVLAGAGQSRLVLGGSGPLVCSGARAVAPSAWTGPLDDYTTSMVGAWSAHRRLLASYEGPLLEVRESGSSSVAQIGVTAAGILDTAALLAHCGTNSGYVTKLYDQSGAGRNFVQGTAAAQPRIVNAGVSEANAGVIAMRGLAGATAMALAASVSASAWLGVAKQVTPNAYHGLVTSTDAIVLIRGTTNTAFAPTVPSYSYRVNGTDKTGTLNPWCDAATKVLTVTGTALAKAWLIGVDRAIAGRNFDGYLHEFVFYAAAPPFWQTLRRS